MRWFVVIGLLALPLFAQRAQRLELPSPNELLLAQELENEQRKFELGATTPDAVAAAQQELDTVRSRTAVRVSATEVIREPGRILLRGKVSIVTGGMAIEADEADYSTTTGEIQPRGNVRILRVVL